MRIFIENAWYWIKGLFVRELSYDDITRKCVNKELKPYGVDYDYVVANPTINGKSWYTYYTFNSETEYLGWKRYCIKQFKKKFPYLKDEYLERKFTWFDLNYGLRHTY